MSFESYLDSIGARPQTVYGTSTFNNDGGGSGDDAGYSDFRPHQYSFGDMPRLDDPGRWSNRWAHEPRGKPYDAYVDSSGGFLGYGSDRAALQNTPGIGVAYSDYMAQDQDRIAQQKRDSLANQQAQLDMVQQRAAMRAASANSPQFTGSGLVGMGQQGMAPQQMAPQQQFSMGRSAVPSMGRSAVPGQGLLGGMHRGGNL